MNYVLGISALVCWGVAFESQTNTRFHLLAVLSIGLMLVAGITSSSEFLGGVIDVMRELGSYL